MPSHRIEVRHDGLHKYRVISGTDYGIVAEKARVQRDAWDSQWAVLQARQQQLSTTEQRKQFAIDRTEEALAGIAELEGLLRSKGRVDGPIKWKKLHDSARFPEKQPDLPEVLLSPPRPDPDDPEFAVRLGVLDKFFVGRRNRKELAAQNAFAARLAIWEDDCDRIRKETARLDAIHTTRLAEWQARKDDFERIQADKNRNIDEFRSHYEAKDAEAIKKYVDIVLQSSRYPETLVREWVTEYDATTGILVLDYRLPALDDMPTIREFKFVASRNAIDEVALKDAVRRELFDSVVYQICIRTVHEVLSSDAVEAIQAVVFNGWVIYMNPATGHETKACIMTIQVTPDEFKAINVDAVVPKACFRQLKGVGSSRLNAMAPVQPLLQLDKEDKRFVPSHDVASKLDAGTNLAAIGWEEFEHLIRGIFEKEFSSNGGEVKVTQASRDGGVDAVAFDPDPIRGGKIVIQAKRYTNPVGVSAVRDLYGTVMNEGATKGILVTTSNYGPDAYTFAKDKPLTLMDGNNLLFLLSKHGTQARIDLSEAKKLGVSMVR